MRTVFLSKKNGDVVDFGITNVFCIFVLSLQITQFYLPMKTKFLLVLAMLVSALSVKALPPKVVAHRGYWQTEGSAQNSLRALVKADSIGTYASEFDVWMTADSVLVVNHDVDINGIVIETATYAQLADQQLKNGETIPTLEQYLKAAEDLDIRLVCELKVHNDRGLERHAVADILSMIKAHGLEGRTDYITFSYDAFKQFCKDAPSQCGVYYLTGELSPAAIGALGGRGIDYSMRTMRRHPEWIDEAHNLSLEVNIWTVDATDDMQWCIDRGADYITTNRPEELQGLIVNRQQ